MANFYDGITNTNEKQKLKDLFISKQQAQNEKLMNEQANVIESLQLKCKRLRSENNSKPEIIEKIKIDKKEENSVILLEQLQRELADFKRF